MPPTDPFYLVKDDIQASVWFKMSCEAWRSPNIHCADAFGTLDMLYAWKSISDSQEGSHRAQVAHSLMHFFLGLLFRCMCT